MQPSHIRGIFSFPQHHVLFNMAVFDQQPITNSIRVYGALSDGGLVDLGGRAHCSVSTAGVLSIQGCTAILGGNEAAGARVDIFVNVTEAHSNTIQVTWRRTVGVTVYFPRAPVQLQSSAPSTLRQVDVRVGPGSCSKLLFQRTPVLATALFEAKDHTGVRLDISSAVQDLLQSSNPSVARINKDGIAIGVSSGTATIHLGGTVPADGLVLTVTTEDPPTVGGIEFAVAPPAVLRILPNTGSIGATGIPAQSPGLVRYQVEQLPVTLTQHWPAMSVSVAAILSDGTRLTLTAAMGLRVATSDRHAMAVEQDGDGGLYTVRLPAVPVQSTAVHLEAVWSPPCHLSNAVDVAPGAQPRSLAHYTSIPFVSTASPAAVLQLGPDTAVVATASDPAALVGVKTSVSLETFLLDGDDTSADLSGHPTVTYAVVSVDGPPKGVQISATGTVALISNNVKSVTVQARIVHQKTTLLSNTVRIMSVGYADLTMWATPDPPYPGSKDHTVTAVSKIRGTSPAVYQQATVNMAMQLTNGSNITLTTGYKVSSHVVSVASLRGVPMQMIQMDGSYAGLVKSSSPMLLELKRKEVHIVAVRNMRAIYAGGLQIRLGVELSDKTQYPDIVDSAGAMLFPGLVQFTTTDPRVVVDNSTGQVTVLANVQGPVTVRVLFRGHKSSDIVGSTCTVHGNLDPAPGDIDLGALFGVPVPAATLADIIHVPIRLNTGTQVVGAFDFVLEFGSGLALVSADSAAGEYGQHVQTEVLATRTHVRFVAMIPSSTLQGPAVHLGTVAFRAVKRGTHWLKGYIISLENDQLTPDIILENTPIVAGNVNIEVQPSRHARGSDHDQAYPLTTMSETRMSVSSRKRRVLGECDDLASSIMIGDMNCDCKVTPGDALFLHNYAHTVNIGSNERLQFAQLLSRCPSISRKMDVDGNSVLDVNDAIILFDAIAGSVTLLEQVSILTGPGDTKDTCSIQVTIESQPVHPLTDPGNPFGWQFKSKSINNFAIFSDAQNPGVGASPLQLSRVLPLAVQNNEGMWTYENTWNVDTFGLTDTRSIRVTLLQTVLLMDRVRCTQVPQFELRQWLNSSQVSPSAPNNVPACLQAGPFTEQHLADIVLRPCEKQSYNYNRLPVTMKLLVGAGDVVFESDGHTLNSDAFKLYLQGHGGAVATTASLCDMTWQHLIKSQPLSLPADKCTSANYSVTFTATCADNEGNVSVVTTGTFAVLDSKSPAFTKLPESSTLLATQVDEWMERRGGARAIDSASKGSNASGITWSSSQIHISSNDITSCRTVTTVEFTAMDACGNGATARANYTILKNRFPTFSPPLTPPVAKLEKPASILKSLLSWKTAHTGGLFNQPGVLWELPSEAQVTLVLKQVERFKLVPLPVPATCLTRTVRLPFKAIDACGNTLDDSLNVLLVDQAEPVIFRAPSDLTMYTDDQDNALELKNWIGKHAGAEAKDPSGVTWTSVPPVAAPAPNKKEFACHRATQQTVTFLATDGCGNSVATSVFAVTLDRLMPQLDTPPQDVTITADHAHPNDVLRAWLYNHAYAKVSSDVIKNNAIRWSPPAVMWTTQNISNCGQSQTCIASFVATDGCGHKLTFESTFVIIPVCAETTAVPDAWDEVRIQPEEEIR